MKFKFMTILILLALVPVLVLAHGYGWNQGWGHQMGFIGGGWMMIIWMIVIVFLIVTVVKWLLGLRGNPAATNNALTILAERFAKGEITREQYEEMRKVL